MVFSREVTLDQIATWPPYVDGCPKCVNGNGYVPYAVEAGGRGGVVAFYRHARCGYQWSCGWSARSDARVA